jgi:hypothetical protein
MIWSTGITTARREPSTFDRTMLSLARAGFDPHIFKDWGVSIDPVFLKNGLTERSEPVGAWKNWLEGLKELRSSNPSADFYGMFQDDIVLCKNIRPYLEHNLWPSEKTAVVSIFTPCGYSSGKSRGWEKIELGRDLWMAQAYIFNPAHIDTILNDEGILSWQGRQNIDSNVGECLQNNSLEIYYHVPSLCQHFSMTSAIYPDKPMPAIGLRSAIDFVGEHYDTFSGV